MTEMRADDMKNWVEISLPLIDKAFPLSLQVQGLGRVHAWLRTMELETIGRPLGGSVAHIDVQLLQSDFAHHVARYWLKYLFDFSSMVSKTERHLH